MRDKMPLVSVFKNVDAAFGHKTANSAQKYGSLGYFLITIVAARIHLLLRRIQLRYVICNCWKLLSPTLTLKSFPFTLLRAFRPKKNGFRFTREVIGICYR